MVIPMVSYPLELGTPLMSPPVQGDKFFTVDRLEMDEPGGIKPGFITPKLALSHDVREDKFGKGVLQTTHLFHGEAGGKIDIFGRASLIAVAKIPVYVFESTDRGYASEAASSSELLKSPDRLSWRSEMAIPLSSSLDLSLFYDRSNVGRFDRSGMDDRDEKFGTRIIFRFK
jgi:hypothetical protein